MSTYWFGGGPADWSMGLVSISGTDLIPQLRPGSIITGHNAQSGGTQYTDLAMADGTPVSQVEVPSAGDSLYGPGQWPRFRAPVLAMWVAVNDGPRVYVVSTDVPDVMQQAIVAAQNAQAAASAAAGLAAELASSSSVTGHEAAPDPHPGYVNTSRGDVRYLRARPGTIAPLQEPMETATFSSTPPQNAANWSELWVIHEGVPRLVSWENERRYPRHEQVPGALWDKLYEAVVAHNGTGRAYSVQIRGADNIRRDAGGIDAKARLVTSDQPWTQIVAVDPDGTGRYSASPTVGPSPLGVRWDSDDVARVQGRVRATSVVAGDSLATLPAGFAPLSARLHLAPTSTGSVVAVELLPTGRIVARNPGTIAGPLDVSLDDVTYARVVAPQPTGDWEIEAAGAATPGAVSPAVVAHAGATGRLYLLVLARSSAADPYTTVTDTGGNTWTRQAYAPTSGAVGRRIELWTCQPSSAFASVSAAYTGSGTAYASLYEVTGHNVGDPIDQVAANHRASATAPEAVQVTPGSAGTLAVAAIAASPNTLAQMTPSSGWTVLPSNNGGPSVVYRTDPDAGTPLGVAWTLATASGSGHVIATINPE